MIYAELEAHILETLNAEASRRFGEVPSLRLDAPPNIAQGELAIACFPLAKAARKSPALIAKELAEALLATEGVGEHLESATPAGPYINIRLKAESFFPGLYIGATEGEATWGHTQGDAGQKVMVEYSSPNTNKPIHLGHIRNIALGDSVCSLLEATGNEVVRANLINDRGVHICKSMLAYQRWGEGVTPASVGKKGDHLVGDYYVKFSQELAEEKEEIKDAVAKETGLEGDKLKAYLETNAPLAKKAQAMLRAWEEGDEEVRALWTTMNDWVLEGFHQTYERMGIRFDTIYRESETYQRGKDIALEQLKAGTAIQEEDGSVWIDLSDLKLGKKILLRRDGTSVYFTQDLGTAIIKEEDHHMDRSIYVVATEQELHFRRLFEALKRFGYPWAKGLFHLSYGMVNLPEGKMKSREGTVVDADDLMDTLFDACLQKAEEAKAQGSVTQTPEEMRDTAEAVAQGALKFYILKVGPKKGMIFNPEESISLSGDTGPYVQYAYARIQSLIARGADAGLSAQTALAEGHLGLLGQDEERILAKLIARFPHVVKDASNKLSPSTITSYLIETATAFNKFYNQCSVLKAEPDLASARLALCEVTGITLGEGLRLLGIPAPKAM